MRSALWGDVDPYAGLQIVPMDAQGWRTNHPVLMDAVRGKRALCEVGAWKGASVLDMARVSPGAEIVAVDTFRGSSEHWLWAKWRGDVDGLYDQFRSNMVHAGVSSRVVPLPLDSVNASEVCKARGLRFDVAHIDAGHDARSAHSDLEAWSALADCIVVDDYSDAWPGVVAAVQWFSQRHEWRITRAEAGKALLTP